MGRSGACVRRSGSLSPYVLYIIECNTINSSKEGTLQKISRLSWVLREIREDVICKIRDPAAFSWDDSPDLPLSNQDNMSVWVSANHWCKTLLDTTPGAGVSTFVSVTPVDDFRETVGQFPAVFVVRINSGDHIINVLQRRRNGASFRSISSLFSPALNPKYCQTSELVFGEPTASPPCMLSRPRLYFLIYLFTETKHFPCWTSTWRQNCL